MEENYSLLIATINRGYSDQVMEVAKKAGAIGGTVIHARRIGPEEPLKKWGIDVQEEREMLYLLVQKEKKISIMQAISQECGFQTEIQGVVVSVPVDEVSGPERQGFQL